MAIAAATVWEVRSTGSAINGGGFVTGASGIDYSQQNTAQKSVTDLVGATANTATPTVTSASVPFDSNDVGNILHITAGTSWTVGWYQVVSVTGVTATLDRACASIAAPTAGTSNLGGALNLGASTDSTFATSVQAGNKIWLNGAMALGASVTFTSGTVAAGLVNLEGYATVRGDKPVGATRPSIDATTAFIFTAGARNSVSNVIFTGASTIVVALGGSTFITDCKITNSSATASRPALSSAAADVQILKCEAISYRGPALTKSSSGNVFGCYFHDSNIGINDTGTATGTYSDNIISGCVTDAAVFSGGGATPTILINNTFYGSENKLGIGLSIASGNVGMAVINNIFYGFVTAISDANLGGLNMGNYNDFSNNTTNYSGFSAGPNDITLNPTFTSVAQLTGTTATTTAGVLTDSAQNFSTVTNGVDFIYVSAGTGVTAGQYLITAHTTTTVTTSPAITANATADKVYEVTTGHNFGVGSNMLAKGIQGTFPAGLTTGFNDLGAAQIQSSSGGTGSSSVYVGG